MRPRFPVAAVGIGAGLLSRATVAAAVEAESAVLALRRVTTDEVLIGEALERARQEYATSPTAETTYAGCVRHAAQEIAEHGRLLSERERWIAALRRRHPSLFRVDLTGQL
jgi:hypothetical protein